MRAQPDTHRRAPMTGAAFERGWVADTATFQAGVGGSTTPLSAVFAVPESAR